MFQHHIQLLFEAIKRDDPQLAKPFFFPVVAYEQVKAIKDPARDWRTRLWRLFERDIHTYHRQLGADPDKATFEGIELRERAIKWMKPGSEGNRIGYYRVTRNPLRIRDARGRLHTLQVTSFISWRGEWYVVHLNGFE